MDNPTPLAFCDTETTGLDPNYHEIWEVGLIMRNWSPDGKQHERSHHWFLPVDLGKADAFALGIGKFYDRYPGYGIDSKAYVTDLIDFAEQFAKLTRGSHMVGAVPSFDSERLTKLLRENGACPGWHYHLVDVEALCAGWLGHPPPWKSDDLSKLVLGEDAHNEISDGKHTALGDAEWARRLFDAVMSGR